MVTALALTKELMLGMWSGEQCFSVTAALWATMQPHLRHYQVVSFVRQPLQPQGLAVQRYNSSQLLSAHVLSALISSYQRAAHAWAPFA